MLSTNLLPHEEKRTLWFEETRRMVFLFLVILVFIFLVGVPLLLPSYIPIAIQQNNLRKQLAFEEAASKQLRVGETVVEVQAVRHLLASVRATASEHDRAGKILNQFLEVSGAAVVVQSLSIKQGGAVQITGLARTRRDLLQFESSLRDGGMLQEISLPLSNIIRETDVSFSMQGKLKSQFSL